MGTIQAGVGIISGLPIDDIVTQLIAIEARPLKLVENQIARVQAQRTGFLDISARMLALKATISRFDTPGFFRASKATSSNENVLLATAEEGASTGSFSFLVRSLVSSHQLASNRFADRDTTPVGAGRITLEVGNGLLNESTTLDGEISSVLPTIKDGIVTVLASLRDKSSKVLRANLRVDVYIVTDRKQRTLRVRRGAFASGEGVHDVFVVRSGKVVRTPLRIGLLSFDYCEVAGGLIEGDEVIISDMKEYAHLKEVRLK